MQQRVKDNKIFVNLEILIDSINESYLTGKSSSLEKHIYNTLSFEEIAYLVHFLQDRYSNRDLLDELLADDKEDMIMNRILYNLSLRYYVNVKDSYRSNDFFIRFFVEQYILLIFNNLFSSHISSSKGMSDEYIEELNKISKNINFKHTTDEEHRINYCMRYFMHHSNEEVFKEHIQNYLNELLDKILRQLSALSDEELEQDKVYAKAIIYQTLLRSIMLISSDLEALEYYRKMYLDNDNDSIASSIIKTAFIANINDRELIVKAKIY